jgi:hypothetical protein
MAVEIAISPREITWSRNKINYHLVATDGVNPYTPANLPLNYKIKVEIWFEKTYESNVFQRAASLEATPDASGLVPFDLQGILHRAYLESLVNEPIPSLQATVPYRADNIRRYYLRYREEYGNPIVNQSWITLVTKKIIAGGIDQAMFASTDYISTISSANSLLTWHPATKQISDTQKEYLSWYNYTGADVEVVLQLDRFTENGQLPRLYKYEDDAFILKANDTLVIPVDHTSLGLSNDILNYKVRIIDKSSPYDSGGAVYLSPEKTYQVDYYYRTVSKQILYLNSFFLPEVVFLKGEEKKTLKVSRQISQSIIRANYTALSKEKQQYNFDWDNVFSFRTGYLSRAEVDALQQMLIYNIVYEITDRGYQGILLDGKSFEILNSFSFLHALEFSAVRALKPVNYINFFLPIVLCCCDGSIEFANEIIEFANGIITF